MFKVVADTDRATLHVQLGEHVTVADLNQQAAALECEAHLEALQDGGVVLVNAMRLEQIEMEAQGVLLFLLQRALRIPGITVVVTAPESARRRLEQTPARRFLSSDQVRLFSRPSEAFRYAQQATA